MIGKLTGADGAQIPSSPALTRDQVRSRRRREVGKATENLRRVSNKERRRLALLVPELSPEEEALRPRTRGDCENGFRPCPWVSCRYHLYLDVSRVGNLTLRFPDLEVDELPETCALDVALHGGESLEATGELYNLTRERIRQLQERALWKLQRMAPQALKELQGEGRRGPAPVYKRTGRYE